MTLKQTVKEWQGIVVDIRENEFDANLLDVNNPNIFSHEIATINKNKLPEHDFELLVIGAIFTLTIYENIKPKVTFHKSSFSDQDVVKAKRKTDFFQKNIKWY